MGRSKKIVAALLVVGLIFSAVALSACSDSSDVTADGKTLVTIVSYKQEALDAMQAIQDKFNETHDDIELKIDSPNEAVTIIRTMLIRDNPPDIIAIGGDMTYANFLEADLFVDISDVAATQEVKPVYMEMLDALELIPKEGTYGLPYFGNAAGVLYNMDMFEEHHWEVPQTYDQFIELCKTIQSEGILPMYVGFKDTWTTLAPWNAIASSVADADLSLQVNRGETTFAENYRLVAEEVESLMDYVEPNPVAYGYNDACTAFANGESAMFPIGSYAIPQIRSVNPDMAIGSFTFPAFNDPSENKLNSGIDFMFCVMEKDNVKTEAITEVLNFLYQDDVIQIYYDDQGGIPCKEGDYPIPDTLTDMAEYIKEGRMADYQDHHYPSEMSVDALIQTFILDDSPNAIDTFLSNFDTQWTRYNRDTIAKLEKYYAENGGAQ